MVLEKYLSYNPKLKIIKKLAIERLTHINKWKKKFIEKSVEEYPKMSIMGKTICRHFYGNWLDGKRQENLAKRLKDNAINYSLAGLYGNLIFFNTLKISLGLEALKLSYKLSGGFELASELGAKGFFIYAGFGISEAIIRRAYIRIAKKPIAQLPIELGWILKDKSSKNLEEEVMEID